MLNRTFAPKNRFATQLQRALLPNTNPITAFSLSQLSKTVRIINGPPLKASFATLKPLTEETPTEQSIFTEE